MQNVNASCILDGNGWGLLTTVEDGARTVRRGNGNAAVLKRHLYQSLPVTERLAESVLTLPTGTSVGAEEIAMICQIIRFSCEHARELNLKLTGDERVMAFSGT